MAQEDQYKEQSQKVNPLVLDMLNRAFADQKEQDKEEKTQEEKTNSAQTKDN